MLKFSAKQNGIEIKIQHWGGNRQLSMVCLFNKFIYLILLVSRLPTLGGNTGDSKYIYIGVIFIFI